MTGTSITPYGLSTQSAHNAAIGANTPTPITYARSVAPCVDVIFGRENVVGYYGMVYVDLYSVIVANVCNGLCMLVPRNSQVFRPCLKEPKSCSVRTADVSRLSDVKNVKPQV